MTFLNNTLAQLNQEKNYHEEQVAALENQIDSLKVAQEYGEIATASVSEAIDNINPEHLELLKEHLLSLFDSDIAEPRFYSSQEEVSTNTHEDNNSAEQEVETVTEDLDTPTEELKITNDIFYDNSKDICYIGFAAKGRANNYGNHLSRVLDIADKFVVRKKPTVTIDSKYELKLEGIAKEDAKHLANFNLKLDYDHADHKKIIEPWESNRKRILPPSHTPAPSTTPIEEITVGEIVCSNGSGNKQYKVLGKTELAGRPHLEVLATYNSEFPQLVGKTSYLGEAYRVLPENTRYDF